MYVVDLVKKDTTLKEEDVDLSEYNDFADARSQIGRFLEDVYMTKRIYLSQGVSDTV
jgi:hypothetical protein